MNFATVQYLIFIVVVFFAYWHLKRRHQNIILLIASYFFYASWDWRFLSLIIISTLVDFACGRRIHNAESSGLRKGWLILSIAVNLGILGYFKYFNFFADNLLAMANSIGWQVSRTTLDIILPLGISFYTFQTLSYTIDIYRRKLRPTKSFITFATFVAFFPQLVAGPIVRAREFVFQLEKKRHFTGKNLQIGLTRFLFGFFKKTFVADTLAVYLVDPVFANPGDYSTGLLWLALLGYSVQIYADFSGYSSMAIGSARILGFEIPENFLFPYLATNFADVWRRWHMTMSRFFRDYVYIGLGGNRHGMMRTLRNIAITTLISGLWHGDRWTFVTWGALHGLFITINHLWRVWKKRRGKPDQGSGIINTIMAWLITQLAFCFLWIVFRAQDFHTILVYMRGMVNSQGEAMIELPWLVWIALGSFVIDHLSGWIIQHRQQNIRRIPDYIQALAYATMIVFIYHARPEHVNPFIYFQF